MPFGKVTTKEATSVSIYLLAACYLLFFSSIKTPVV